jgi:hypothetical protein
MTFNRLVIALGLMLVATTASGQSVKKYCEDTSPKYDVHLFGYTFEDSSLQKMSKKILTDFRSKLKVGEHLRMFSHSADGYSVTFDQCLPGCPEAGFVEKYFSSSCRETVAKRDLRNFNRSFAIQVLKNYESVAEKYDIFKSVQQLSDVYRSSSESAKVYAVISMVPAGVKPNDRRALNLLFRKADQAMQFPTEFPAVNLIGASSSKEIQEFWAEVLKDKAKFSFVRY